MRFFKSTSIGCALLLLAFSAQAHTYNMKRLASKGKDAKSCTEQINKTIQKASAKGGGTLYFPAGTYITGAIEMADNITIYLEAGATLSFTSDFDEYLPYKKVRWEGVFMQSFKPLIYGDSLKNVSIKGEGTLDGNGEAWQKAWMQEQEKIKLNGSVGELNKYQQMWGEQNIGMQVDAYYGKSIGHLFFPPPFVQLLESENILISGVSFINAPLWTINPVGCKDIRIDGVIIENTTTTWNADGIVPSSCQNVSISNCNISVGSDCISLKSGRDGSGRSYGRACEDIVISNCVMRSGKTAIAIGSEMSGGVKQVVVSACVFDGTDAGICFNSSRGRGGAVENIRANNIIMHNVLGAAISLNPYYDNDQTPERVSVRTPQFRNIHFSNISATNIGLAGELLGLEEMPTSNVSFSNIQMQAKKGFQVELGEEIEFRNVDISTEIGASLVLKNCNMVMLDDVRSRQPHQDKPVIEVSNTQGLILINAVPRVKTNQYIHLDEASMPKEN